MAALPLIAIAASAHAQPRHPAVYSPAAGVLCDRYVCADDQGISRVLTERYLGKRVAAKAFSQGDFDPTEFTFANGVFCDVKERLCRDDRYYGADGKRSGAVSRRYTELLFGRRSGG
ncbi:prophage protein [Burkholderia pseudomallei]|nr:prophage protein [Burkholderia pseudomallei]